MTHQKGSANTIKLKRVYDPVDSGDGVRFLVERLWPRGIKKTALHLEAWLKDAAPSSTLRRWFAHDPRKWRQFRQRYFRELSSNPAVAQPIIKAARRGPVTLLYSVHDSDHNNAVALKDYVESRMRGKMVPHRRAS